MYTMREVYNAVNAPRHGGGICVQTTALRRPLLLQTHRATASRYGARISSLKMHLNKGHPG